MKILKDNYTSKEYADLAVYCNENKLVLTEVGDYLEGLPLVIPLEELQANKKSQLKAIRDAKEIEDIEVNGYLFDYDNKAKDRLGIAYEILKLNPEQEITWTLADNTQMKLTLDICKAILVAVATRSTTLHANYNYLKEQIYLCNTEEELDGIVWE